MKEQSPEAIEATYHLTSNEDFTTFTNWLRSELSSTLSHMASIKEDIPLRWNQGACIAIKDILAAIDGASEAYERIHRPQTRGTQ